MKSKKAKPLWRITVLTTVEAEDAVCELLASVSGLPAAAYFDLERQTSHASIFVEQGSFSPALVRQSIAAGLAHIRSCGLNLGKGEIEIAKVKREDWAESWKRHFKPIEVKPAHKTNLKSGSAPISLLVKPSWSKRKAARRQAVVVLDPGLSFGTGQHPTTSFCLHEIVAHRQPGTAQSFLDIGTGSGILAIAAVKMGYAPVQAFDFDPECVRVSQENARKNRVENRLKPVRGDITKLPVHPSRQFDLVCANLISNLLISERRRIVNRVKKGGKLVLAGILATEFSEVEKAFADVDFRLCNSRVENEWCSGAFCFR